MCHVVPNQVVSKWDPAVAVAHHSEHIPLKATIPKAADMGSPTVPSAGARNETGVCIKCAEPSPGTLASFSM